MPVYSEPLGVQFNSPDVFGDFSNEKRILHVWILSELKTNNETLL